MGNISVVARMCEPYENCKGAIQMYENSLMHHESTIDHTKRFRYVCSQNEIDECA